LAIDDLCFKNDLFLIQERAAYSQKYYQLKKYYLKSGHNYPKV